MITNNPLIKHFAKPLALKKIGNFFNRPLTITKIEKLYIIASILLMNQKRFIIDLITRFRSQNSNPNLKPGILN